MTVARVNYINIALMLISAAVAFCHPLELFLFSYAVLGPLHYLTEISGCISDNIFAQQVRLDPADPAYLLPDPARYHAAFWSERHQR